MAGKAANIMKILLASYIITGILMVLLAAGLYKMQFSKTQINIGIMAIYVISTLAGGYIFAKKNNSKRLLCGLVIGILYFAVISIISFVINKGLYADGIVAVKSAIACIVGGCIGGMIS